jgi:hypothetical protein
MPTLKSDFQRRFVVLRPGFGASGKPRSLKQIWFSDITGSVQPATMIGFKQIEFFDHTRSSKPACQLFRVLSEIEFLYHTGYARTEEADSPT